MHQELLQSERIILKGIDPAYIHRLFETKQKAEIMAEMGLDETGFAHFLHMHEKGMETERFSLYFFLLIEKDSGKVIGECGFHTWNRKHHRAELFYNIKEVENRRKGYMKEVLPLILSYGFHEMDLNRIQALVAEDNEASIGLLLKFGFSREGVLRGDYLVNGNFEDSVSYSLLRKEWEKS